MAPEYIAPDTYTGKHTVAFSTRRYRVARYLAVELAKFGDSGVIFESMGHVDGVEHFGRSRYIIDGDGRMHCYDSDGAKKIVHPADRVLRILTGK